MLSTSLLPVHGFYFQFHRSKMIIGSHIWTFLFETFVAFNFGADLFAGKLETYNRISSKLKLGILSDEFSVKLKPSPLKAQHSLNEAEATAALKASKRVHVSFRFWFFSFLWSLFLGHRIFYYHIYVTNLWCQRNTDAMSMNSLNFAERMGCFFIKWHSH